MQDVAALSEAQKNYRALISEFQQTKQTELAAAETKAASLVQEVVKAGQRTDLQTLTLSHRRRGAATGGSHRRRRRHAGAATV